MAPARKWLGLAGAVLLAAVAGRAADPPKAPGDTMPRAEPDRGAPAGAEAKGGTVTLTQKEYQDLLDRLARYEGQAKAEPPSKCKLTGRVAGDVAHLRAEFEFHTSRARARVALACTQGFPTEAKIDGSPPSLKWGGDGLSVLVEDAGDHQVVLEMDLALAARDKGAERGLDLDLPAALTTTFDLELPAGVKKALVRTALRGEAAEKSAGQEVKTEGGGNGAGRLSSRGGLGPVERLEITWEGPAPAAGPPLLSVDRSRVTVHVDQLNVRALAQITVGVRRGQLKEFQLLVPPGAVVRPKEGDDRVKADALAGQKGSVRTVTLTKPTADPVSVTVEVPPQRAGGAVPVGPFVVLGAFPQGGDVLVTAPADVSLDYHPRGESQYLLTQREPTDDEKKQAPTVLALRYGTQPGAGKADPQPFLDLAVGQVKGQLDAALKHVLRLVRGDGTRPDAWRLTTTLDARALYTEVEQLVLKLPPGYALDEGGGAQLAGEARVTAADPDRSTATLQLTPKRKGPFRLTFEGQYAAPAAGGRRLAVGLPTLDRAGTFDHGAEVTVVLPDDLELVAPRAGPLWEAGKAEKYNRRTWKFERWPERFEVAWQPYRPELTVNGEARVTLSGRVGTVRHRLWLPPGQAAAEALALDVPDGAFGLAAAGDAAPRLGGTEGGPRTVTLPPAADRDHPLVLEYSFRLPERRGEPFVVPLVAVRQATAGETRLCVWCDPGTRPEPAGGRWDVCRVEEVKDEGSFPALVLLARRPEAAPTLCLGEADGTSLPAFRVRRALIQATVGDIGQQTYRARFLLTQLAAASLDVELPAPLFQPNADRSTLRVLFETGDGAKDAVWQPVDDAGRVAASSKVGRVRVPAGLAGKSAVLEVFFALPPGRTEGSNTVQTVLQPPLLRGDAGAAPVRWQVALPPTWVPLSADAVGPDYGWGRRGWLLALRPTPSGADLERWFAADGPARADDADAPAPAVVAWRSSAEPLRLSHAPQQAWLLLCSLALLVVGLALAFLALPRLVFWGALLLAGAGALAAGLFWPGVLAPVLYGCQPGVLVLLPVLGVQWLLQRRYRRQVVFLPGFTRVKAGSSLTRGTRPRGEPSTVDAAPPAAAGSEGGKKQAVDGAQGQ